MRIFAVAAVGLVACAPEFAVVPAGGVPSASAPGPAGGNMTAFAEQWGGDPYDLADYVTPIAVELYNGGAQELRVSFVDFALRDESGRRFAAISPFIPNALGQAKPAPFRVAGRGGFVGPPGGARSGGGGRMVGPPAGRRSFGGWGVNGMTGGAGFGGFRVWGGLRGYYGGGVPYWSDPWMRGSGAWLFWGPSYYPAPPSHDVLFGALPEGVLPPGARAHGFLYFQKATSRETRRLDLAWILHDARTGVALGETHLSLDVLGH